MLTEHHPWLGAWSSASETLGDTVRNLGPLQLDLLAPFTKLDPYWGTAVGVGLVAAASRDRRVVVGAPTLGPVGAGAAMLATLALEAAIGTQPFIDPRQQIYLLMPYWALLWLTWATAMGIGAAVAPLVLAGSLIVQTHFTFLFQTVLLVVAGLGCFVVRARHRWSEGGDARPARRVGRRSGVLGAAAVGPAVRGAQHGRRACRARDQRTSRRGSTAPGSSPAPCSCRCGSGYQTASARSICPLTSRHPGSAWISIAVWFTVVLGAATRGVASRASCRWQASPWSRRWRWSASVVAGARIPLTPFGYAPQNYFWMWPTGVFLTVALAAGLIAGGKTPGAGWPRQAA